MSGCFRPGSGWEACGFLPHIPGEAGHRSLRVRRGAGHCLRPVGTKTAVASNLPGLFNYGGVVFRMMAGFYVVIAQGNLVKKLVGLGLFQASVIIF